MQCFAKIFEVDNAQVLFYLSRVPEGRCIQVLTTFGDVMADMCFLPPANLIDLVFETLDKESAKLFRELASSELDQQGGPSTVGEGLEKPSTAYPMSEVLQRIWNEKKH